MAELPRRDEILDLLRGILARYLSPDRSVLVQRTIASLLKTGYDDDTESFTAVIVTLYAYDVERETARHTLIELGFRMRPEGALLREDEETADSCRLHP